MMKDRIKQIMDSLQLTQQDFANKLGISPASLSNIFNGRSNPTNNHVQAIHRAFPEINTEWLMFGEGQMLRGNNSGGSLSATSPAGEGDEKSAGENSGPASASSGSAPDDAPDLFSSLTCGSQKPAEAVRAEIKPETKVIRETKIVRPKVVEIRVFYDDQTFESFVPSGK